MQLVKIEDVVDVFRRRKFELLPVTEKVLEEWADLVVQDYKRMKEVVKMSLSLNDLCYSGVVEFGCVSLRTGWVKLKFASVKVFQCMILTMMMIKEGKEYVLGIDSVYWESRMGGLGIW